MSGQNSEHRRPPASPLVWPFLAMIKVYRVTLSPIVGRQCRYEPTCSRYAEDAYRLYGPIRGTWMTAKRLARCHPFVRGGYDPVPIPDPPTTTSTTRAGDHTNAAPATSDDR